MAEYIEREAAYPLAKKICDAIDSKEFQRLNFGMRILDWIDNIPAADVRPVVWGKDISATHNGTHCEFKCSECGAWAGEVAYGTLDGGRFNFCPNCGAEMKEKS